MIKKILEDKQLKITTFEDNLTLGDAIICAVDRTVIRLM